MCRFVCCKIIGGVVWSVLVVVCGLGGYFVVIVVVFSCLVFR